MTSFHKGDTMAGNINNLSILEGPPVRMITTAFIERAAIGVALEARQDFFAQVFDKSMRTAW
jgi:hypothetical protein